MKRAKRMCCLLLAVLMLLLSACAGEPEDPFLLRVSVCGRIDTLEPAMNADRRTQGVFCALYENLMRLDDDGTGHATVAPGVAKEYRMVENFDGSVDYTFTLRSSAHWSDGRRVSAEDFVFAWRRLVDPATESPNHALLSVVSGYDRARETGDTSYLSVKAENETTFHVTLSTPCSYFIDEICTMAATMPLRSELVGENANWTDMPSNGAYCVGVWAKDDYLQLRRNTSYHESSRAIPDMLRFYFMADPTIAWGLYVSDSLDYTAPLPERAVTRLIREERFEPLPDRSTVCVLYNHISDVFSDEHARRAFDFMLDRAAIAAAVGQEMEPATGLVPHGVENGAGESGQDFRTVGGAIYPVDEESYEERRAQALNELYQTVYRGSEEVPKLLCLCSEDDDEGFLAASVAAEAWNELPGVSVDVIYVTAEEYTRLLQEGEYDLAVGTFDCACGDAMRFLERFAGTEGNNALHYASTPYDLLIGVANSTRDADARAAFLHDAEALLLGDTALSPLYFRKIAYVLNDHYRGVYHDSRGNAYFTAVTRVSEE